MGNPSEGGGFRWDRAAIGGVGAAAALFGAWHWLHERPDVPDFDWQNGPGLSSVTTHEDEDSPRSFFGRDFGERIWELLEGKAQEEALQHELMSWEKRCVEGASTEDLYFTCDTPTMFEPRVGYELAQGLCTAYDGDGFPVSLVSFYMGPVCKKTAWIPEEGTVCEEETFVSGFQTGGLAATDMIVAYASEEELHRPDSLYPGRLFLGSPYSDGDRWKLSLDHEKMLERAGGLQHHFTDKESLVALEEDRENLCEWVIDSLQSSEGRARFTNGRYRIADRAFAIIDQSYEVPTYSDYELFTPYNSAYIKIPIEVEPDVMVPLYLSAWDQEIKAGDDPQLSVRSESWGLINRREFLPEEIYAFEARTPGCGMNISLSELEENPDLVEAMADCYFEGQTWLEAYLNSYTYGD